MSSVFRFIVVIAAIFFTACAPKIPSETRAADVIKSHLKNYGHDYKDSFLGKNEIKEISILSQKPLQRKRAETEAFVTYADGKIIHVRFLLIHQLPLGWQTYGWEILDRR